MRMIGEGMPADSSALDLVLHPVRSRIVQQLGGRTRTTAQLREALPDVTQATLYRHVTALLDAGVVTVVEERRVRGATERTLALGDALAHVDQEGLRAMSTAQLASALRVFLADLAADADRALAADEPALRDLWGFGRGPIHVDADDLAAIQEGFAALLAPYLEDGGEGKRRVSLATVLLPEPPEPPSAASAQD